MSAVAVRRLEPGDEAALEAFLAPRWQSSMFLRSNARAAGLVDHGQPLQATYLAAWRDGAIVAVAAQSWTGMLLLQVPDEELLALVVPAAAAAAGRPVTGLAGPYAQIAAARAVLELEDTPATMDSRDDLFTLTLAELRLPSPLSDGRWHCRAPRPDERDRLADWRADYHVETLGTPPGPAAARVRSEFTINDVQRVLVVDGEAVAFSTFNARLPDVVQVGGVFTPPSLRGRGYGRAVVAGSLAAARAAGVSDAILFTGERNHAARRAYEALGFRVVGDYGLVLFA